MTTFTPQLTVGEIAARFPASIRIFEKYRIDFCCGGKIPLDEACGTRGVNPAALLEEIESASAPEADTTDWQSADIDALIDHILTRHHAYLKTELPRIEAMLAKVIAAHGERHGAIVIPLSETFAPLKAELEGHLMKEEVVLFPLIRSLEAARRAGAAAHVSHCGSVRNPLRVMLMEHDSAGDALAQIRTLTSDFTPPDGVCNTFRGLYFALAELEADLHRHIHLENNILFPRAIAVEQEVAR